MATENIKADTLNASFQGMANLPIVRQVGLLLGLAASIALGIYVVLWFGNSDFKQNVRYQRALVDNNGNLLSNTNSNSGIDLFSRQLEYKQRVESQLAQNIENILSPIVGANKIRAQVSASMDFAQTEMTQGNLNPGMIRRLSVAVIIDHRMVEDARGKLVSTAYTPAQLARFTILAKESVGFDAARGDSVNVINAQFSPPPKSFFQQAWMWGVSKQVLGGLLAVLMLLGVLRPVMRNLAKVPAKRHVTMTGAAADELDEDQLTLSDEHGQRIPNPNKYISELERAKAMVIREPKRVAQVVKQWVNEG